MAAGELNENDIRGEFASLLDHFEAGFRSGSIHVPGNEREHKLFCKAIAGGIAKVLPPKHGAGAVSRLRLDEHDRLWLQITLSIYDGSQSPEVRIAVIEGAIPS